MRQQYMLRFKRTLRHMTPKHAVKSRLTSNTIERFAERIGLVYFGYVDQKDDDHRLVRGHTVSSTHIDKNYCVGSLRGYDVTLVSRNDDIISKDLKHHTRYHWLIATIDLKTKVDTPHIYIGHESRKHAYLSSFEQLMPLTPTVLDSYPKHFTSTYTLFGKPTHAESIGDLIVEQIADTVAAHFKHTSIEIEDNCVYLYIESEHPSEVLLEKTMSNGLWIAEAIDTRSAQLQLEAARIDAN